MIHPVRGERGGREGEGRVWCCDDNLLELPSDVVMTTTHWHTLSTTPTEL